MGNWLDKTGLTLLRNILATKFATKLDSHPSNVSAGKFLQTDSNGNAVWGDAASSTTITNATEAWLDSHISSVSDQIPVDDSLLTPGAAADAKAAGDLIIISSNTPSAVNNPSNKLWFDEDDISEHTVPEYDEFTDLVKKSMLETDLIPDTSQSYIYDSDGKINTVTHTQGAEIIRTDVFVFGDGVITEMRTLETGESLTITTNLETLATSIVYADAE